MPDRAAAVGVAGEQPLGADRAGERAARIGEQPDDFNPQRRTPARQRYLTQVVIAASSRSAARLPHADDTDDGGQFTGNSCGRSAPRSRPAANQVSRSQPKTERCFLVVVGESAE